MVEENAGMYDLDIVFYSGRTSSSFYSSVTLYYDDGSGETSIEMVKEWHTYIISLESFTPGSNITFHLRINTIYGDTFDLSEQVVTLPGGGGIGIPIDPMILLVVVGGIGVVVVLVIVMKKRGT